VLAVREEGDDRKMLTKTLQFTQSCQPITGAASIQMQCFCKKGFQAL
jgi:hypothetical protein